MGSFQQGCDDLADKVGHGKLIGVCEVDQVYAAAQHQGYWVTGPLAGHVIRNHSQGGQAKFLEQPLFDHAADYMRNIADGILEGWGVQAMAENMEDLSRRVHDLAPREFDDLRDSGHPQVFDDGRVAYDRAPLRPRLSKSALKEKSKRRALGEGPRRSRDTTLPFGT